jgi:2-hydroxycyclohexanecarboxyl-CoA dehydrogenase
MSDHANDTVLITGGAHGIGRAVAQLALDAGARVCVWALHPESIEAIRTQWPSLASAEAVDVGDWGAVERAFYRLTDQLGPVTMLINCAGYTLTQPFLSEAPEYWHRVVDTNFWGTVYTTRMALPAMIERRGGSIVNVVSDAGRVGMAGEAVYAGSKGGVIAFSKSIAQEVARYQVRVNCVAPGPTRTRILETNSDHPHAASLIEKMLRRIPLGRIAEPEEVAQAVWFLAGSGASHITGQVLSVSGGLTMV